MIATLVRAQRWFEDACIGAGYTIQLLLKTLVALTLVGRKRREVVEQLFLCVLGSLPVVFTTAMSIGMIVSLQTGQVLREFRQESQLGYVVILGMFREMGPVFTSLSLAGLVGSTFAAELGTMKVSEEIDALEVMSIDPVYFLVLPRVIALGVGAVVLTVYADVIGTVGGAIVARASFGVDFEVFMSKGRDHLFMKDVWGGLSKAFIYGTTVGTVACSQGLRAQGGPAGVGLATLRTVVISFTLILIFDYLLTWMFW